MIRAIALPVTFLTSAMVALAADQSSKSDEPDVFDIEPPILKQNLSTEPPAATGTPDAGVARWEKQLERAKENAMGAERLCKIGVLSKVEVEQRALKVTRCEAELANARVAQAKASVADQESRVASGETAKQKLDPAKTAMAQLIEAAQLAAWFSQAKKDPKVDVHYTERKFVSKPKGAKPGMVRLQRFKNITVQPNEAGTRV